ncbi:MAG: RdgB/HAM1 family non-canonical purine NTP pyrophosphatase [Candidatus Omnitrophica bacterium]|nr:RdgB/HAM1 family non-canonical purine NTP pyrophosphatase [Candidatus Omnitrophota bacterium]
MKLIIATNNKSKLKEIKAILGRVNMPIISLNDLDKKFHIKENGKNFLANAIKKTKPVSFAYPDDLVAGEDSGLSVDYLKGRPGVYSKRYSGKNWTYEKNNLKILKELEGVAWKRRKAHFIACLALMKNGRLVKKIGGRLNGFISLKPKGTAGFGYDPILYIPKYRKTVAQLSASVKNKISHRALAFRKLKAYLRRIGADCRG